MFKRLLIAAVAAAGTMIAAFAPAQAAMSVPKPAIASDKAATVEVRFRGGGFRHGGFRGRRFGGHRFRGHRFGRFRRIGRHHRWHRRYRWHRGHRWHRRHHGRHGRYNHCRYLQSQGYRIYCR